MQPKINRASQSIYSVTTISAELFPFRGGRKILKPQRISKHMLWVLVSLNDKSTVGFHVMCGWGSVIFLREK